MASQITLASSFFYSVITIFVFVLSLLVKKSNSKICLGILLFVMCFVAGFRNINVGRDTAEYVKIFNISYNGLTFNKDPGFSLLCRILMHICNHYSFLLLFFSLIIYGFTLFRFWELRDKSDFCISVFSFYSFYYFESLNIMRQFCAIAIVFWGTRFITKRKYLFFIISVIIATLFFHKSAIIGGLYLVMELFSWKDLKKIQRYFLVVIISISGIGFLTLNVAEYTKQYDHYFDVKESNVGMRIPMLLFAFFLSIILYRQYKYPLSRYGKYIHNYEQGREYVLRNSRLYYLVGCLLASIGYFYDFMGRIGYYFILFVFVYFGIIFKEDKKHFRFSSKPLLVSLIMFIVGYVLYGYLFKINGSAHHPYHFVWC
ncbi:EpsG family protein [Ruminococcus flavefaciens]|uniref:EpsG family protein n=1 Tax=Ruminococcus flavefaciens TaxID=1265 RepID=A0A1K1MEU5_RUMFL|nr:EpsG family protein [Ruminococcus flavefaciens]SFW21623.1 EpsG family protein [Ruminococcus flavefaciens]